VEFRVLGPLEVVDGDEPLLLGGGLPRRLLALLLLNRNQFVSSERLIDVLWEGRPPETASKALQGLVSQLRKAIGQETVLTRPSGYVLRIDPGQYDADRFGSLVEEAMTARPEVAATQLRQALALWRGPAFAEFTYDDFARTEIGRLEELRAAALEQRIDVDLLLGRHRELIAELSTLTKEEPLRERLREQLMIALYRSGRQAEALEAYEQARRFLLEELGLEPSEELKRLQRAILAHDPALGPADSNWRLVSRGRRVLRRPRVLAGLGALLLAGAVGSALFEIVGAGGARSGRASADAVAFLNASSGNLAGQVPLANPLTGGGAVAFGFGSAWAMSESGYLSRIEPSTVRSIATIPLDAIPGGIALGAGSVWVSDANSATLLRIDPLLNIVADRLPLPTGGVDQPSQTWEVAFGAGSVWVAHGSASAKIERIDARSGRVQRRFDVAFARGLAFGDGALWASTALGRLLRIDGETNSVRTVLTLHSEPYLCCVAVGGGYVWLSIATDGTVWKISEDGSPVSSPETGAGASDLTYADNALWVSNRGAGTVARVDPVTDEVRRYPVGHAPAGIGERAGLLAVGVAKSAADVTAGLHGRIATIAFGSDSLGSTDPALTAVLSDDPEPYSLQLHYATCAKLLNYPDAPAPTGSRLVPEVAAAAPVVSDRGRTYTFTIRSGYHFSPPSGEPVTAASFRRAIERVLSPKLGANAPGTEFADDIVGAHAFRTGKTARISGIRVDGDMLAITLKQPAPDFPTRLTLPYFCAVPVSTPVVVNGVPIPIPSAGPYYVAAYLPGEVAVLKRNPNYSGPRPHYFDAIVYHFRISPGAASADLATGSLDYYSEWFDRALAPNRQIARAAGKRYRQTPQLDASYVALNSQRGLFRDRALRRAVNYALDRPALARTWSELPSDRILPSGMPSAGGTPTYPTAGPDLRRARALVRGRRGTAVLYTCNQPLCKETAPIIRSNLAAIGIRLVIRQVPGDVIAWVRTRGARWDMVLAGTAWANYADSVAYLEALPFLDRAERAELRRISALRGSRRERAAMARADTLTREGPTFAVFGTYAVPELFSATLGCTIAHPIYQTVDLSALCRSQ
jgi:DNA-binding SARP family transcriptional activator/ABC-type transport system substrate-binding protein